MPRADGLDAFEVRLAAVGHAPVRVGILSRDPAGDVRFVVDDAYIDLGPSRPILATAWYVPGDNELTARRLRDGADKVARLGFLPPWFSNLLPEGALRTMVEAQMPTGRIGEFDLLRRLGRDLPGAVVIAAENEDSAEPPVAEPAGDALPRLRFSLAGLQLKFSAMKRGECLAAPAAAGAGQIIAKLPSPHFPDLPEVEYASMKLAEAAGVRTAASALVSSGNVAGVPERLLCGPSVLAVERFDRTEGGRIHIEDFAQLLGRRATRSTSAATKRALFGRSSGSPARARPKRRSAGSSSTSSSATPMRT